MFNYDVKLGSLWAYDYVLGQHMDGATITAWTVTDATGPTATVHVTP